MKHREKKYKKLRRFMKKQGTNFGENYVVYNQVTRMNNIMMPAVVGGQKIVTNGYDELDAVRKYYKLWRDSIRMQKKMAEIVKREDRHMRYLEKNK